MAASRPGRSPTPAGAVKAAAGVVSAWTQLATHRSAEERVSRFMVWLIGLQRVSYLVPTVVSASSPNYLSNGVNAVLLGLVLSWNITMFVLVSRRGWFTDWMVGADLLCAGAATFAVLHNVPADFLYRRWDWSNQVSQAAAALAGAAFSSAILTSIGVGFLVAVQSTGPLTASSASTPFIELIGRVNGLVWYAVIAAFCVRYLRRQGRHIDELAAARLDAEAKHAGEQARHAVQMAHFRALHDTVLPTLSAIARGRLDYRTDQVRERCARDSDFVRRLLAGELGSGSGLHNALGDAIAAAEALGLAVHYRFDREAASYGDPPIEVVGAMAGATREALTNVVKHAGIRAAWVTVSHENDALTIRIVDRGRGFDPRNTSYGFGLRWSIEARMRSVRGDARISTAPGEGTCVELTWRR